MFATVDDQERWEWAREALEPNEAMLGLLERFVATEAAGKVGCCTSHHALILSLTAHFADHELPRVSVEHLPQAQRFRLTFWNWFGVPRDEVYCEVDEALARMVFAANRMHYADENVAR